MGRSMLTILTSVSNEEEATMLADKLINNHLAACVQYTKGTSCYRWQGELKHDNEVFLSIKTERDKLLAIEAIMDDHHPYELPELILLDGEAGFFYGKWMRGELRDEKKH